MRNKRPTARACHATRARGIKTYKNMPLRVRLGLYIFWGALSLGFSVIIFPFFKTRLRLLKPPLPWLNGLKSCRHRKTEGRCVWLPHWQSSVHRCSSDIAAHTSAPKNSTPFFSTNSEILRAVAFAVLHCGSKRG